MSKKTTKPAAPVTMIAGANGHTVILRSSTVATRAIVHIDDALVYEVLIQYVTCAVYILLADAPHRVLDPVWDAAERAMPANKKLRWIPKRPPSITGEDLDKL